MRLFKKIISSIQKRFKKKKVKKRRYKAKRKKIVKAKRRPVHRKRGISRKTKRSRRLPRRKKRPRKRPSKKVKRKRPPNPKTVSRTRSKRKTRKKTKVKTVRPAKKKEQAPLNEILIGEITHYFSKIQVCVIKMTNGNIRIGDKIAIRGHTSNFVETVKSLQIENQDVVSARRGQLIGLKIRQRAREGDTVYKVLAKP